jgi:lipopolysaccharide export system protein LptA
MFRRLLSYFLLSFLICFGVSAQEHEDTDSLVRLLGCDELRQQEENGKNLRKALGHARFQHNGTLLLCDTALWHVDDELINAYGHVQIIQDETILTGEKLDYFIQDNLAQFRGALVQLQDKKKNTLRTNNLDYNTRDSVAIFRDGGSFRDESGQIIESDVGTYDSKIKTFFFNGNVNMFTDSIFIKTDHLEYNTDLNIATFGKGTNAWQKKNMLSSDAGWYDRANEIFLFNDHVHMLTENQEGWADTLKYYRNTKDAEMFGNAEVMDTTRKMASVAGYMHYSDSLQKLLLSRDPAVISVVGQDSTRDTVYIGGDKLIYWTVPKCTISDSALNVAKARVDEMYQDAIGAYRMKAAKDAVAKAAEEKKKMLEEDPNAFAAIDKGRDGGKAAKGGLKAPPGGLGKPAGGIGMPPGGFEEGANPDEKPKEINRDSLKVSAIRDSLARADSLALAKTDSTAIGYARAIGNVRLYKSDMQMMCDSLEYCDLDSLVRLFIQPVVWNEDIRQYSADSISLLIKNRTFDRASLMSQAFIIIQEDTSCYDQIKATDMMAYFDTSGVLKRFDAMGNVAGVFYIEENKSLATVNKFEAKMLTANFKDGSINDLNYFEEVKSDAYPVVQMTRDERFLKDFKWLPDKRPKSPQDVTSLVPRSSMRAQYESIPHAAFPHTEKYFPGYMNEVDKMLAQSDSLNRVRRMQRDSLDRAEAIRKDSLALVHEAQLDSLSRALAFPKDTLSAKDSLNMSDSLAAKKATVDSLKAKKDSLAENAGSISPKADSLMVDSGSPSPDDDKVMVAKKTKVDRATRRKERLERLEKKDQEKAAKKAAKQLEKQRKKTLKALRQMDKRAAKEQRIYDRYKAQYEKQKAREDARKARKDSKDASRATSDTIGKAIVDTARKPSIQGSKPIIDTTSKTISDTTRKTVIGTTNKTASDSTSKAADGTIIKTVSNTTHKTDSDTTNNATSNTIGKKVIDATREDSYFVTCTA